MGHRSSSLDIYGIPNYHHATYVSGESSVSAQCVSGVLNIALGLCRLFCGVF